MLAAEKTSNLLSSSLCSLQASRIVTTVPDARVFKPRHSTA